MACFGVFGMNTSLAVMGTFVDQSEAVFRPVLCVFCFLCQAYLCSASCWEFCSVCVTLLLIGSMLIGPIGSFLVAGSSLFVELLPIGTLLNSSLPIGSFFIGYGPLAHCSLVLFPSLTYWLVGALAVGSLVTGSAHWLIGHWLIAY